MTEVKDVDLKITFEKQLEPIWKFLMRFNVELNSVSNGVKHVFQNTSSPCVS